MKRKFYNYIIKHNIHLNYDVYEYAMLVLERYLKILFLTLIIAYHMRILFETIIYLFLFSILRKNLGGIHFKHNILCLIFSVISSILIPYLAITIIDLNFIIAFIILSIDIILTEFIGCIDHPNKKVSEVELLLYKRKALFTEVIYTLLYAITYFVGLYSISNLITFTITFNVISLILANLKRGY